MKQASQLPSPFCVSRAQHTDWRVGGAAARRARPSVYCLLVSPVLLAGGILAALLIVTLLGVGFGQRLLAINGIADESSSPAGRPAAKTAGGAANASGDAAQGSEGPPMGAMDLLLLKPTFHVMPLADSWLNDPNGLMQFNGFVHV